MNDLRPPTQSDTNAPPASTAAPAPADSGPWYKRLGPGLLTGASDDDPSGIAVYVQAGSQFGLNMLWMTIVTLPMMVAVQLASAHVGRDNRAGLIAGIREHYSASLAKGLIVLVVIVNIVNVGADLAAMGDATALVVGGRSFWFATAFGVVSLVLQVTMSYERYARWLKWMTLSLAAYVLELAFEHTDWTGVARSLVMPQIAFTHAYATTAVAVLGTTISPYLFVWQAALEVEEARVDERRNGGAASDSPRQLRAHGRRMKFDTWIGMLVSNVVAFSIMVVGATVFFARGQNGIATTAQAAEALRPIAGPAASLLFALGIVGSGLLAIPSFAGSAAYGCAEAWRFRKGLDQPVGRAPAFYAVLALCIVLGVAICFSPIDPIKALYWSAVLNSVAAVPMLVMVMLLSSRRDVARPLRNGMLLNLGGWAAVVLMAIAVSVMFADMFM
jgi:NRAMP (natural resistance-associated macrophage protein)-like metal ion transporter